MFIVAVFFTFEFVSILLFSSRINPFADLFDSLSACNDAHSNRKTSLLSNLGVLSASKAAISVFSLSSIRGNSSVTQEYSFFSLKATTSKPNRPIFIEIGKKEAACFSLICILFLVSNTKLEKLMNVNLI
ncbi:MAG TPA: hypothetical protein VF350_02450 [Candidatus Bathyarchaeia archaeon]